jgi:glycosyltransferase involved in cell wall biosynthesis
MESEGITNTIFVDDHVPLSKKYKGIANRQVANLMQISNLFIFPTKSEACPLVLMEAALAGCLLVLNTDVPSLGDVIPHGETLYYPFGTLDAMPETIPFVRITDDIIKSLDSSAANKAKRHVLKHFNIPAIAKFLQTL